MFQCTNSYRVKTRCRNVVFSCPCKIIISQNLTVINVKKLNILRQLSRQMPTNSQNQNSKYQTKKMTLFAQHIAKMSQCCELIAFPFVSFRNTTKTANSEFNEQCAINNIGSSVTYNIQPRDHESTS